MKSSMIDARGILLVGAALVCARQLRAATPAATIVPTTPPPALHATPTVSVLVAAWNEAAGIDAHIASFCALGYPQIELVVCAGGHDATYARAMSWAGDRVRVVIQQPGEGKQAALARAYLVARGEILVLTDADCRFDETALRWLLAPIINEGEQITTGGSRPFATQIDAPLVRYAWAADMVAAARAGRYVTGILGRNAALTRAAIARIGGLGFTATTGTDYQLAKRLLAAGLAIRHVPQSIIVSCYPAALGAYRARRSRWLRNVVLYGPHFGAHNEARQALLTMTIGALMTLVPFAGARARALWVVLLLHTCLARLGYLRASERAGAPAVPAWLRAAAPLVAIIDFAVWGAALVDLLRPNTRRRW